MHQSHFTKVTKFPSDDKKWLLSYIKLKPVIKLATTPIYPPAFL